MRNINWNPFQALTLLGFALALAGCGKSNWAEKGKQYSGKNSDKPPTEKAVLVELAEVKRGMIEAILERSAPLEAEAQVEVSARTSNPAIELLVEEGDKVEKNQVLLRLESDKQKNDFDQAKSQFDKEQIDFDRHESLYGDNLISEQEYRNANFSLTQRRLAFEEAKRQFEYTDVRAPIKGTITLREF